MPADSMAARSAARLRVIVLTCADMGVETADGLKSDDALDVAAVISAPYRRPSLRKRVRRVLRQRGVIGLAKLVLGKLGPGAQRGREATPPMASPCGVPIIRVDDLHSADCLDRVAKIAPDVAVVDGTYILESVLFDAPRLGSINIHCGQVPDYRGTPPVFWELFDGTEQAGVTIHRVSDRLDEGAILAEQAFPIDIAPAGDPVDYATRFWRDVLRPAGMLLLLSVLRDMAAGHAVGRPQPPHDRPANRTPTVRHVRELRRRVKLRRRARNRRSA